MPGNKFTFMSYKLTW